MLREHRNVSIHVTYGPNIKYNYVYFEYVNIASVLGVLQWNDFTYESRIPPQCKKMAVGCVEMWLLSNHANCLG